MKRKALLILIVCLFSLVAWTTVVQTKTYEINFSPQNFVVNPLKGDTAYIQCKSTCGCNENNDRTVKTLEQ